jgi:hypothetical protein
LAGQLNVLSDDRSGTVIYVDDNGDGRYGRSHDDRFWYAPEAQSGYQDYGNAWPDNAWGDNDWYGNGSGANQYYGYAWGHNAYYRPHAVLPARVIADRLRWYHFRNISSVELKGAYYKVKARDWRGHRVKLYVDAYTGRVANWSYGG